MEKLLSLVILALLILVLVALGCPGLTKLDPPQDIHPPLPNLRCPPEKEWSRVFGGARTEDAQSVEQTADGGFIITGSTNSFGAGSADIWLVKTDAQGNKEWSQTFGGPYSEWAVSVQQTVCGGFIIAGSTRHRFHIEPADFWLVKTDPEGNKEWSRTFGGPQEDRAHAVQQTADGGFIIAGWTESFGAGGTDCWLVKTDPQGNKEWSQTFGGRRSERADSVQQTACGGFIIAGFTTSFGAGGADFWLVKTDPEGNKEWSRTLGGRWSEWATSVRQTGRGGFIIAGKIYTRPTPPGVPVLADLWLVKTDPQGNKEWSWTFLDGPPNSLDQTACGGFIIARSDDLIKTDPLGNKEWRKQLTDAPWRSWVRSVQQTACGGFILAGSIDCSETGQPDFWLVKLAPEQ